VVTGAGTDVLTLASSNAAGAQPAVKIALSGTGLAAGTTSKASLSPASVAFADQKVGSTSGSQKVTLSNPGTAPLNVFGVNIGGANAADFKIASNGCTTVAAGASCDIGVSFAPTADGARSASLTVSDDAADSPQSVPLSGLAHAGLAAVSPTLNAGSGFPDWYEDSAGIRLTACINPADPCLAGSTVPDPTQPATVPTNYPAESFYYNATATANAPGGFKATYTAALEQAFGNVPGSVVAGDQITFGRIEVKVTGGLTPGAKYTVTEPYGTMTLTANADGTIAPIKTAGAREQTGCGFVPPACDFGLALGSRVGPFLTRSPANDPATVPVPKTGFIGDAVTPMKVVGSPFDTNVFTIKDSAGNVVASTDLFTVAGKEAGPLVATPQNLAFGDEPTGTTSLAQQVTVTNLGASSLTLGTAKATGPFAVEAGASNTCDGASLAQDDTCSLSVTFSPSVLGKANGTLTVASTNGDLVKVALNGNGTPPPASNASLSASTLTFAPQHVGTTSAPQTVTVKNTGAATLNFDATTPVAVTGANASEFNVGPNACTGTLAAGATCDTSVTYTPGAATASNATLTFSDDSGGSASTQTVALTGTGAQPTATLSAGTLAFGDVAVNTASSPQTVTVTNNGNEDLVIGNVALTGTNAADFGIPPTTCTRVLPGASCSVDVTFKPGTTGAKTAALTFTDNAGNGSQSVSLTGNGVVPATPSVTAPSQRFTEAGMPLQIAVATTLANSTMPIALRWSPVGTTPVDHYELQSSVNGGVMTTASTPAGAVTSDRATLKIGSANAPQTYQFQVRACASPGTSNCSAYSAGPKFTVSPLDDTGVAASAFKGTWKTAALAGAYGGTVHWSSNATSTVTNSVTFNVTGNVAIASTMGPDRGQFSVAVDGKTVASPVDLYSATVKPATVPVAVDGVAAGSHTVTITVLKTKNALSKGTRVDLDAYVILK
jgi:Abnormal spindle-like microcephaly-assoc'd, ASPM-SPD-2-Hydin